jgi:hypothetical protein
MISTMSVNHYFLPVTDEQLNKMINDDEYAHDFIFEEKKDDWVDLSTDVLAIIAITSPSDENVLSFVQEGAIDHEDEVGDIGSRINMGSEPASYYKNSFLKLVAKKLKRWTVEKFESQADTERLEEECVYPSGWTDAHRKPMLVEAFALYRDCILNTAKKWPAPCGLVLVIR